MHEDARMPILPGAERQDVLGACDDSEAAIWEDGQTEAPDIVPQGERMSV